MLTEWDIVRTAGNAQRGTMAAIDVPSGAPEPYLRKEVGIPPAPSAPPRDKLDMPVLVAEAIGFVVVVGLGWLVKRRLDRSRAG